MNPVSLPSGKLISDLKVDGLRKELSKRRLSKLGKKQELLDRLAEFILNERLAVEKEYNDEREDESQKPDQLNMSEDSITEGEPKEKVAITPTNTGTPDVNLRTHSHRRSARVSAEVVNISSHSYFSEDEVNDVSPKSTVTAERKSLIRSARKQEEKMEIEEDTVEDAQMLEPKVQDKNGNVEDTKKSTSSKSNIPVAAKSRSNSKGRVEGRFKNAHAKLLEHSETLEEAQDKLTKRHRELMGKVPDVVKRLATPKSVTKRQPLVKKNASTPGTSVRFDPNLDLTKEDAFKFGDIPVNDFGKVVESNKHQESITTQHQKNSVRKLRETEHQIGAKEMAKKKSRAAPIPLTRPMENTFINFMSTPKGNKAEKEPKRGRYTPYKGAVKFLDTTKLTAQEYALAVEEGLIPATSKKSASKSQTSAEVAKMNRKQRTDQILSIKRKLAI